MTHLPPDNSPKHLWLANAAAPVVQTRDLRFSSTANEIESEDGSLTLLDRVGEGDASQWVLQKADGTQENISERQVRYMGWTKFTDQRAIRVFLSSTFRDMQVERQYLGTTVFPRLRRLALSLGVQLQEIDLRWGITLEEAHRGKSGDYHVVHNREISL